MMPQEKLDRFPQGSFTELAHRLRVFLDRHMQRIAGSENLPCGNEAFQLRRGQGINRLRVIRQPTEDLLGYALRLGLVLKVFLNTPSSPKATNNIQHARIGKA